MNHILALCLALSLLAKVDCKLYTVGVRFDLAKDTLHCEKEEDDSLQTIIKACGSDAGLPGVAADPGWQRYLNGDLKQRALEAIQGKEEIGLERRLSRSCFKGDCYTFCVAYNWPSFCECCTCCGEQVRRQLRADNIHQLESMVKKIKNCAEAAVADEEVACVDSGSVEVLVEPDD